MTSPLSPDTVIGVIGAGTMGAGIAQVAAAAGHPVLLYDVSKDAAKSGRARLAKGLESLVTKGRMTEVQADRIIARIGIAETLHELASCGLVLEAIIEKLEVKQQLFPETGRVPTRRHDPGKQYFLNLDHRHRLGSQPPAGFGGDALLQTLLR